MTHYPKFRSEKVSFTDAPDLINLKEFSERCSVLKSDINDQKTNFISQDLHDFDDKELTASLNPSLLLKWQKQKLFETDLQKNILTEDASSIQTRTGTVKEEDAVIVKRLSQSQLSSVENFKMSENSSTNLKFSKDSIGNFNLNEYNHTNSNISSSFIEKEYGNENSSGSLKLDEIILTLSIYPGGKASLLHPAHKQELEVKGTDFLNSLIDEIYCLSGRVAPDIISDASKEELIKNSAFYLIEGVFYDDPIDEKSQSPARPSDIYFEALKNGGNSYSASQNIISDSASAGIQRASLKSTQWIDLKVRLNKPYLFAHLGGCEHILVITQIRAAHSLIDTCFNFPQVTQSLRVRRRKCRVCEVYAGTKMLINDKLMPENPCVICDKCFNGFHGTGQRWYADFDVVPYYHEF